MLNVKMARLGKFLFYSPVYVVSEVSTSDTKYRHTPFARVTLRSAQNRLPQISVCLHGAIWCSVAFCWSLSARRFSNREDLKTNQLISKSLRHRRSGNYFHRSRKHPTHHQASMVVKERIRSKF